MNTAEIVVGTDGSVNSAVAVWWAAREAARRRLSLRIVHAYDVRVATAATGAPTPFEVAEGEAESVLASALLQARQAAPAVEVHRQRVVGDPAAALVEVAAHAAAVVVGNRGHGGFASLLLGSVSRHVATHARCPVVVVRGRHDACGGPVVVGVDTSPAAQDALGLAFQSAADRRAELLVVRAVLPEAPAWAVEVPTATYSPQELVAMERRSLAACLSAWQEKFPQVRVDTVVTVAPAGRLLADLSCAAQLVVVGSRRHGSVAGMLLGSVGLHLLHHADCPVLIDRTPGT